MLICPSCQFANPIGHKFCQHCGEPLVAGDEKDENVDEPNAVRPDLVAANPVEPPNRQVLQAILMPPEQLTLSPATYIEGSSNRYEVLTVLSQGVALVNDTQSEVRSPLQQQLPALGNQPLTTLQATTDLPAAAYPYLLLTGAAPPLHDVWQQAETTVLITATEPADVSTLIQSFSTAIDPLQHVYWLYILTDLWAAIAPLPQWRNSLLLANNLCITRDQSVRIRQFIPPRTQPGSTQADSTGPAFSELKAFLQSLLAQPHRGNIAPLRQMRKIILTVTSAQTLEQLQTELATIGQYLLATPEAITPPPTSSAATDTPRYRTLTAVSPESSVFNPTVSNPMEETTPPENSISLDSEETEADALEDDILIEEIDPTDSDESTMVLPMKLISIESAGQTDVGRQRDHNEDCFFISSSTVKRADNKGQTTEAHSLYVLCDGMGGHAGGEVASQLAAETLSAYFTEHWPHPLPGEAPSPLPSRETLVEAVSLANQAIFDINEKESRAGHERMGTTLVVVLLQGTEAVVAHVGDSRLYQHTRRIGLRQITTDHEVGQREMQRGIPQEIAYARPDAYQLTQALGPRGNADLAPSVSYLSFSEDTLLLLCSDGLSDNNLVEDYLSTHLDPILKGKKEIEMGVDELIKLGNEVNGHDNISAIAIRVKVSPDLGKMQEKRHLEQGQTVLQ